MPTIAEYLKYANLQMAAEAFLVDGLGNPLADDRYLEALKNGNTHASKFTSTQADAFVATWKVVDQCSNTTTGFSGTLFQCIKDDPATGASTDLAVTSFANSGFLLLVAGYNQNDFNDSVWRQAA